MTQPDTHKQSHVVVIDVHAEPKCCCVCMEPLKWVAVGRCGHRDVCGGCATRIRFFLNDRRCCSCRTNCPTVLVTKADTNRRDSSSRPLQSGLYQWYHGSTGAYFDDWHKYMATVRAYDVRPPLPAAASGGTTGGRTPSDAGGAASWPGGPNDPLPPPPEDDECQPVTHFGIYLCVIMMLVLMFGLFFKVSEHYYQKVAIVVAFGVLSALVTAVAISIWRKYNDQS